MRTSDRFYFLNPDKFSDSSAGCVRCQVIGKIILILSVGRLCCVSDNLMNYFDSGSLTAMSGILMKKHLTGGNYNEYRE